MFLFNSTIDSSIKQASAMAAESFSNNPLYKDIFRGNVEDRIPMVDFLFLKNLAMLSSRGRDFLYYSYSESGDMECFFILVPNDKSNFSFWEKMSWGLYEFPFRCGFESTSRLIATSDCYDKFALDLMKDTPNYLHLQRMVVNVNMQGKGIGSRCLGKALNDTADKLQLPVILSTQDIRNVTFYSRLGFELVRTEEFKANNENYSYISWFMIRQPKINNDM